MRRKGVSNGIAVVICVVVAIGGASAVYVAWMPRQAPSSAPTTSSQTVVSTATSSPSPFVIGGASFLASDFYEYNSTTQYMEHSYSVLDCREYGLPGGTYLLVKSANNLPLTASVQSVTLTFNGATTTFTSSYDDPCEQEWGGVTTPFYISFYGGGYGSYLLINGGQPVRGAVFTGTIYLGNGISIAFHGTFS